MRERVGVMVVLSDDLRVWVNVAWCIARLSPTAMEFFPDPRTNHPPVVVPITQDTTAGAWAEILQARPRDHGDDGGGQASAEMGGLTPPTFASSFCHLGKPL